QSLWKEFVLLKSLFSKEALAPFKDKKLLIAICAVIFVPILYVGMFLSAFWDSYHHLQDVPVAIVNEDSGYEFEGEYLTIGDELVDNLKDEPEFDFHFVDGEEGYEGLHNQDYYIMIKIPEDFSKNSTTMMDDVPKKSELIYVPNESYNFLAAQMGETAMLQIEMALEEKITETYAETIFDTIGEVADGLVEASDGTEELNDGAIELKDGTKKIKDNLKTLASKSIEFSDGVNEAYEGSNDLTDGAKTLASGISELYDNSNKLKDASEDLESGAGQLADGISQANGGVQEMKENVPKLVDGTNQVQGGLDQFSKQLPREMAGTIDKKIEEGSQTILAGTEELRSGIVDGMENKLAPELSTGLTDGLSQGLSEGIVDEANQFIKGAPEGLSKKIAEDIVALLKEKESERKQELIAILEESEISNDVIDQVSSKFDEFTPDYDYIEQLIEEKLEGVLEEALKDVQITGEQQKQLEAMIKAQIQEGIDDPIGQLQGGLTEINNGQSVLRSGVKQLADGTQQLQSGSLDLMSGQNEYVNNMYKFTDSFAKANNGTGELVNGTNDLNSGLFQLYDGSIQLSDGSSQLSDGSNDLYDGMTTLTEGTEEFNDKMHEAADEASDVNATDDTYNMMANPIDVGNEKINEVPNYGTGFAPYFLSLGLFVGALLLSIVYPLREPSVVPSSGMNWFLKKFIGLFTIGILQALIASGILLLGLKIEVQSVPLFILFAILTSLVFITLVQFLVTCFDDPGRFMAIIILILQLTTSAGTFPLEL